MFKKRKYKIEFSKSYQSVDIGVWNEVSDSYIIMVLRELQKQFNFEIISIELKEWFCTSKIVIRCNKTDKNEIFMSFISKLSGKIEDINI